MLRFLRYETFSPHGSHFISFNGYLSTDPQFIDWAATMISVGAFRPNSPSQTQNICAAASHKASWPPRWETALRVAERLFGLKELKIFWLWSYQEAILSLSTHNTGALARTQIHPLTCLQHTGNEENMMKRVRKDSEESANGTKRECHPRVWFWLFLPGSGLLSQCRHNVVISPGVWTQSKVFCSLHNVKVKTLKQWWFLHEWHPGQASSCATLSANQNAGSSLRSWARIKGSPVSHQAGGKFLVSFYTDCFFNAVWINWWVY